MIKKRTVSINPKELEFDALGKAMAVSGKKGDKLAEVLSGGLIGVPDAKRIEKIPIDSVIIEKQIRMHLDEDALKDLAESMKKEGLVQPIVVMEKDNNTYVVVAGHRRYYAARDILGWKTIDAVVIPPIPESRVRLLQFYENYKREDLTFGELALFVGELLYEKYASVPPVGQEKNLNKDSFINKLREDLYLQKLDRVEDEKLKNAARSVMDLLGITPRTLSACVYFWCLPREIKEKYSSCKDITATHCMVLMEHGIHGKDAEKWLAKASEGVSKRELTRLIKAHKALDKTKDKSSERTAKFLKRVYDFGTKLKRNKQIKKDPELRRQIVEYLRKILEEIEKEDVQ